MSGYSFVLFLHVLSGIELFVGRPLEGTILARIWSALLADLPEEHRLFGCSRAALRTAGVGTWET